MPAALSEKIKKLYERVAVLGVKAPAGDQEKFQYALKGLAALDKAARAKSKIFGLEPWHPLGGDKISPAEYLLRLKDDTGAAMPPYPFVMAFYDNNLTVELDTVLLLSAFAQFKDDSEKQITVNVSAHSLANGDFIKTALGGLEKLKLGGERKIIFEIHESTGNVKMSAPVLEAFKKIGAGFAIDDAGLSLDNVFRLSEFDGIADFVKIDRKSVTAHPDEPHALSQVMSLARSLLPHAAVVAEGVKDAAHALTIYKTFPDIKYAQGLYLPPREQFAKELAALRISQPKSVQK
jgi:EAL domain-containing protein (putative c-di-GMP-specific phosphodiesterase class I)